MTLIDNRAALYLYTRIKHLRISYTIITNRSGYNYEIFGIDSYKLFRNFDVLYSRDVK